MKLSCVTQVPKVSNEELLMLENELLRDELKLREIENSLEIYECILDCIEKTGKVDKSLEVMFGENVSSTETFESEIKAQYEAACEDFMKLMKDAWEHYKGGLSDVSTRIKAVIQHFKKVKDSAFPRTIKMPVFASPEKYNDILVPFMKKIADTHNADKSEITDEEKSEFSKILNTTEDVEVKNSHELFELYDKAFQIVSSLSMSNDMESHFSKSFYNKEGSKTSRDFLAMKRMIERAIRRFYKSTLDLYHALPYT